MSMNNYPIPAQLELVIQNTLVSEHLSETKRQEFLHLEKEAVAVVLRGKAFKKVFIFELVIFVFMLVLIIVGACMGASNGLGLMICGGVCEAIVVVWAILTRIWANRARARVRNLCEELNNELIRGKDSSYPVKPFLFVYGPYTGSWKSVDVKLTSDGGLVKHYPSVGAAYFEAEEGDYSVQIKKRSARFHIKSSESALVRLILGKGVLSASKKVKAIEVKPAITAETREIVGQREPNERKAVAHSASRDPAVSVREDPAPQRVARRPVDLTNLPLAVSLCAGIESEEQNAKAVDGVSGPAQLKRAEIYLEDGDYQKADESVERVLDIDPTCAVAYLLKLCVSRHLPLVTHILLSETPLSEDREFEKAERFATPEFKGLLEEAADYVLFEIEESKKDAVYRKALSEEAKGRVLEAIAIYLQVADYGDSKARVTACLSAILKAAEGSEAESDYLAAYSKLDEIDLKLIGERFPKQAEEIRQKKSALLVKNKEGIYQSGFAFMEKGEFAKAQELFLSLSDYKDSEARAHMCEEALEEQDKEETYQSGLTLMKKGEYAKAQTKFICLNEYRDSRARIRMCEEALEEQRKRRIYEASLIQKDLDLTKVSSKQKLAQSIENLKKLPGYKNADALSVQYASMLEESERLIADAEEEHAKRQKRRKRKRLIIFGVSVGSLAIIAAIVLPLTPFVFIPSSRLHKAKEYIEQKEYDSAYSLLRENGDFGESKAMSLVALAGKELLWNDPKAAIEHLNSASYTVDISYDADGGNGAPQNEIIKGAEFADYAPTKDGYSFMGWTVQSYTLELSSSFAAIKLKANWLTEADVTRYAAKPIFLDTRTFVFGLYPQSNKVSLSLDYLIDWTIPGDPTQTWVLYDGDYYAKRVADWYKCEPIKWRILSNDNEESLVLSENILDTCTPMYRKDSAYIYPDSRPRAWLNGDFFTKAFAFNSSYVKGDFIYEDDTIGEYPYEVYDKVFPLSHKDYRNPKYGFDGPENYWDPSQSRVATPSEWCEIGYKPYYSQITRSSRQGDCSLRADHYSFGSVDSFGRLSWNCGDGHSICGVRPAMRIKLPK